MSYAQDVLAKLKEMGVSYELKENAVTVSRSDYLKPTSIKTENILFL